MSPGRVGVFWRRVNAHAHEPSAAVLLVVVIVAGVLPRPVGSIFGWVVAVVAGCLLARAVWLAARERER